MKESILKLLIVIGSILAPVQPMLISAASFIILDLLTGVAAAIKQKEKLTSAGLQRTVVKLFVYGTVIVLGFVAQTYLVKDIQIVNLITSYVGLTELVSIAENINILGGGNLLQSILDKLNSQNK